MESIEKRPRTKEAAYERLLKAGIIDKSGQLTKIYQSSPKNETRRV